MKILHIANFGYTKDGAHYYFTDRKISAGFVRNNHFVYEFSMRDIARMSNIFKTKNLGKSKANADILAICKNLKPDLVLLGHAQLVKGETLKYIRQNYPETKIALWFVDPLFHEEHTEYMKSYFPYLDAIFVTTGGESLQNLAPAHITRAYFPNPVEVSVDNLKNFERRDFEYELMYCGSIGDSVYRRQFMETVQSKLSDFPLKLNGLLGFSGLGGMDYINNLASSRMGLNHSRRNDVCLYSSDRIAHLTGNGLLALSPKIPDFDLIYKNDEIVYFDDVDDLISKARYYAAHPEEAAKIAEAGWKRAHQSCNAERVTRFMEETIFNRPYSESYEWLPHVFKATS
jgi:hypothetical protein